MQYSLFGEQTRVTSDQTNCENVSLMSRDVAFQEKVGVICNILKDSGDKKNVCICSNSIEICLLFKNKTFPPQYCRFASVKK